MGELSGQVAIVTGAGRMGGMGRATARAHRNVPVRSMSMTRRQSSSSSSTAGTRSPAFG